MYTPKRKIFIRNAKNCCHETENICPEKQHVTHAEETLDTKPPQMLARPLSCWLSPLVPLEDTRSATSPAVPPARLPHSQVQAAPSPAHDGCPADGHADRALRRTQPNRPNLLLVSSGAEGRGRAAQGDSQASTDGWRVLCAESFVAHPPQAAATSVGDGAHVGRAEEKEEEEKRGREVVHGAAGAPPGAGTRLGTGAADDGDGHVHVVVVDGDGSGDAGVGAGAAYEEVGGC